MVLEEENATLRQELLQFMKVGKENETTLVQVFLAQAQSMNDLTTRIASMEIRLMKMEAAQTRLLAFAGIAGTGFGYIIANFNYVKAYFRGLLS